jgi:hypothetical protein
LWNESFFSAPQLKRDPLGGYLTDRSCAYCGAPGPLTRDHVWPSCFLGRVGRSEAKFSHKSGQVHGADYVVADVCKPCNAGPLSELDNYFCSLYDQCFHKLYEGNDPLSFEYKYNPLVRSLLKISYNAARAAGLTSLDPFKRLLGFIRGVERGPDPFRAYLELQGPSFWQEKDDPSKKRKVLPEGYRAVSAHFADADGEKLLIRWVSVNSFCFHLLLPNGADGIVQFERIAARYLNGVPEAVQLTEDLDHVIVRPSSVDRLDSLRPHILANNEQYKAYFQRRRAK